MTFLTAVGGRGALQAGGWQASYLSDHHRESEDTCEIVQALEDDFKERFGVRQPTNGDEGLHSPVVTANVTRERRGRGPGQQRPPFAGGLVLMDVQYAEKKTLYFYVQGKEPNSHRACGVQSTCTDTEACCLLCLHMGKLRLQETARKTWQEGRPGSSDF